MLSLYPGDLKIIPSLIQNPLFSLPVGFAHLSMILCNRMFMCLDDRKPEVKILSGWSEKLLFWKIFSQMTWRQCYKCCSTVTCKVLMNRPHHKLGQYCTARCSILTTYATRRCACLVLLCAMLTPLKKGLILNILYFIKQLGWIIITKNTSSHYLVCNGIQGLA